MKRRSIKSLEGELKRLKRTLHNNNMNNIAKDVMKRVATHTSILRSGQIN